MRRPTRHPLCLLLLVGGLLTCARSPAPLPGPEPAPLPVLSGRPGLFSADRAWTHLESLAAVGPRTAGSEGAARARAYISGALKDLGLDVVTRTASVSLAASDGPRPVEVVNIEATIAGELPDWIVLAAPYDSPYRGDVAYPGVNDGASGAALLLELARVLSESPLPYTVRLYFLDAESAEARIEAEGAPVPHVGSTLIASGLRERGELSDIRLLLYFNRVSDADLRIARDRFSHRLHRDSLWLAAAAQGHADVFPSDTGYEAPFAGHRAFNAAGMRRTVAVIDPSLGEAGGSAGPSPDDTLQRSSPRSLEIVGRVTLAGLESIATRFRKIDRFADSPTAASPQTRTAPPPEPAEAPATPDAAGGVAPPQEAP